MILKIHESVHSSSTEPQPSEAMRIGTWKKKILLHVSTPNAAEGVELGMEHIQ